MEKYQILVYPDPRLRQKAAPITVFDDETRQLVDDMIAKSKALGGGGLAATQIGVMKRIFVMDWTPDFTKPEYMINPEIIEAEGEQENDEGCYSLPDVRVRVKRAAKVCVRFQDVEGNVKEETLDGIRAACVAHEIDHLDGKVLFDYLPPVKRRRIMEKYLKKVLS